MHIKYYSDKELATRRQLAMRKLKPTDEGEPMWTNQYCGTFHVYHDVSKAVPMTDREYKDWKIEEKFKKEQRAV